jgi:hypothetical protein
VCATGRAEGGARVDWMVSLWTEVKTARQKKEGTLVGSSLPQELDLLR